MLVINGDTVKKFRVKLGITQKELSTRVGVSQGYIAQVETNRRICSESFATSLCDILKCSQKELLIQDPRSTSEESEIWKAFINDAKILSYDQLAALSIVVSSMVLPKGMKRKLFA